jgi:hypothetical protein
MELLLRPGLTLTLRAGMGIGSDMRQLCLFDLRPPANAACWTQDTHRRTIFRLQGDLWVAVR